MPKKPIVIILIAACFLISPCFIIIQASLLTHAPVISPSSIFSKFSVNDWIVLALYFACALSVFFVKKWGWWVFVLSSIYLIGNNIAIFILRPHYSAFALIAYDLILFTVAGIFFRRNIIAPYFNPRIRWWEQAPRIEISTYAMITWEKATIRTEIIDISASGIFVLADRMIPAGSRCSMTIHCLSHTITCDSLVMRATNEETKTGIGLMFVDLGRAQKAGLRQLTLDLSKAGAANRAQHANVSDGGNKRLAARYRVCAEARICMDECICPAALADLSSGGCLVQTPTHFDMPIDRPYELRIRCLDNELSIEGILMWHGSLEGTQVMGFAFRFRNNAERAVLRSILASCYRRKSQNRIAHAKPLPPETLAEYAMHTPYKIVHFIRNRIAK
jgi:c-di-GMP-binding flagellar brake protein YcgR